MVSGANPPPRDGAEPLRVMAANLYAGRADGLATWCRAASRERTSTSWCVHRGDPGGAGHDGAGRAGQPVPPPGGPARDERGAGRWSSPPAGSARPTRLDTSWGSWRVPMGDHTLFAVHPHAPTDIGEVAPRPLRDPGGRDRRAAGPGRRRLQRHPRPPADAGAGRGGLPRQRPSSPTRGGSPPGRPPREHRCSASRCRTSCRSTTSWSARRSPRSGPTRVDIAGSDHRALVAEVAVEVREPLDRTPEEVAEDEEFFAPLRPLGAARPTRPRRVHVRLRATVVDRRRLGDRGLHRRAPRARGRRPLDPRVRHPSPCASTSATAGTSGATTAEPSGR